jgi:hypothetical protein
MAFKMSASEDKFRFVRGMSINRKSVRNRFLIISALLVLWTGISVANASTSPQEINRPRKSPSLDQILNTLTESDLSHEGLDQSNLAIDQIVQKANRLIAKASRQRAKELKGKNPNSPLNNLLAEAIVMLTDSNSYLLKLKELQNALIEAQSPASDSEIDPDQTFKDLTLEFDTIGTDLRHLKVGVKTLPLRQRAIADVFVWELGSKLYSAIHRIRERTVQVGTALALESDSDLETTF